MAESPVADAPALLDRALQQLAAGGPQLALPLLDQAIEADPWVAHGRTGARVTRGLVLLELGAFASAREDFEAWLSRDARDPAAWLGLGRSLAGDKQHAAALDAFEQALAQRPDWGDAHWHRATSRAAVRDLGGAVEDLDAAMLHLAPYARGTGREVRICVARAQLRLLAEDHAGAREDFVRAAAILDARGDAAGRDRVIAMAQGLGL